MIKVAIIGCGHIAATHVNSYLKLPSVELAAFVDVEIAKAESLVATYGGVVYSAYQEMLADPSIQLVSICTPHYLHHEMAIACLAAGKHVLSEKPMALSVAEGIAINEKVKTTGLHYSVCYQNRFNDTSLRLKELLETTDFGALKGVKANLTWNRTAAYYEDSTWRGTWAQEGGGVLINQAIHTLDLVCWLVGTPTRIKGSILQTLLTDVIEVEDSAMATALLAPNVPFSLFATNTYSADPPPELTFDFEWAQISLTMDELYLDQTLVESQPETDCEIGKSYWGLGHERLIATFVSEVAGTPLPQAVYLPKADSLFSLQVVAGIYESHKHQDWVEITQE